MKILIAEDDLNSRKFLSKFLSKYGECYMTVDGMETLEAFLLAHEDKKPYDLICLDIMMPKIDGVKVLKTIRDIEKQRAIEKGQGVKVIITTALAESQLVNNAFKIGCEGYVAKPIDTEKLLQIIKSLELLNK
jgi:two-component system, chemotaxis family, chemotaxis protein CheY